MYHKLAKQIEQNSMLHSGVCLTGNTPNKQLLVCEAVCR